MKVFILVLSARRDPWNSLMDCQQATWDSVEHPQTQTLFYCGKSFDPSTEKVFYSLKHDEELERVSARTIEAFEKSLEYEWDFLARPHSSCYVHKANLVEFCETLPKDNSIYGIMTGGDKPFIWGGCHYLITRQAVEAMVANKDKWNLNVMEDNSLTEMVNELGITVRGGRSSTFNLQPDGSFVVLVYGVGDNFTFTDWGDVKKLHPHFFVRVKQDLQRDEDVRIMKELFKHYH